MTMRRFLLLAAAIGLFAHHGARAQTAISANQVACPVTTLPVVAVALPAPVGGSKQMRLVCIPLDPKSFVVDTSTTPPTIRAVGQGFVDAETPSGSVDGTNANFALATAPSPAASLRLYRNGIRLQQGPDYALSGAAITFATVSLPQPGDVLLADYRK